MRTGRVEGQETGKWHRLRLPLLSLAVVLTVGACSGVPTGSGSVAPKPVPAPAHPPAPGPGGGLVGGAGFAEGSSLLGRTDDELARELDGIVATGAAYLRVDFYWAGLEPSKGAFHWAETDRIVHAARARGLRVLALLAYTPAWARPSGTTDKHPPTRPADYADFARAMVEHYRPLGVSDWEIWNEPNLWLFWEPRPDPAAYSRLLAAAHDAIKSVDPAATVITGGLSPAPNDYQTMAPVTFLEGVYAAGGMGKFDAVGHHPSNYPYMPLRYEPNYNDNAFGGVTPKLHETMVTNGDGHKKIWGTEMGAPTVHGMTPEYVAAYVTEAYQAWKSWPFTGPLLWYSYRDAWTHPTDPEANFGLVKANGETKEPALSAYRSAIR
jgi:hypothetical protein